MARKETAFSLSDFGVTRHEEYLSNGTKVVLFERPGMPVAMRAHFLSGSRFDPPGLDGTAHHMEHMITAGSKRFPVKDKMAKYIERLGGGFGAATGKDALYVNVAFGNPADIKKGMTVMSEIIRNPLFLPETFKTEKGSILEERKSRVSTPGGKLGEASSKLFFQGTDLDRSIIGSEESINNITEEDIFNNYNTMLTSGRMVLVASGGITMNLLHRYAEKQLLVPESEKVELTQKQPVVRNEAVLIEKDADALATLLFGFRTAGIQSGDSPALDVLSEVMGGGRAATLSRELRYKRGLIYSVGCFSNEGIDAGVWGVSCSTSRENVQDVLNIIIKEVNRVTTKGLYKSELQFAKDKAINSAPTNMASSSAWVSAHATEELVRQNEVYTISDYLGQMKSLTQEDVRTVAQKYFQPGKWYLAMCGDIKAEDVQVNY